VRVAIVGSRDYPNLDEVRDYVDSLPIDTVIITGGARGVDKAAELAARARGMEVVIHGAEWNKHGKSAGMIRNTEIVNDCDKLVAFWDEQTPGTKNSISKAAKAGKLEKVFRCGNPRQGSLF
jgi:hypothetical protein